MVPFCSVLRATDGPRRDETGTRPHVAAAPAAATEISSVTSEPELNENAAQVGMPLKNHAEPQPPNETDLWQGRTHWKHFAGRLMLWVAANIVAAGLVGWLASSSEVFTAAYAAGLILLIVFLSGTVVVGRILIVILSRHYRLTSQRLFVERGVLSRTIDQTELIRVDDVRIHKSVIDRLFGLGSITIVSTDASEPVILIEGVVDADTVAEAVRTNMRALRQKSLFVETL